MQIRAVPYNSFYFKSTLAEWEQVRDWMKEHNITWHALGNNVISFDNRKHTVMFALRWL